MKTVEWADTAKYFLLLVRYGIFGEAQNSGVPEKPENVNWQNVFILSEKHSLSAATYRALLSCEERPAGELFEKWKRSYRLSVCADIQQRFAWEEIKNYFSRKKIKLLPLKGLRFKELYPRTELRTMGDLDILYEKERFPDIKAGMESLGYTFRAESAGSNHQIFFRAPFLCVEMHSHLLPKASPFSSYCLGAWDKAEESETPFLFRFSKEDEYLYMLMHAYKHFYGAGSGVRTVLDFQLFVKKYGNGLDRTYIEKEMKKAAADSKEARTGESLEKFEALLFEKSEEWFGNSEIEIDETTVKILADGVYGRRENVWKQNLEKDGRRYLWRRLFPPFPDMKTSFPKLQKLPFLLPLYWCKRIFRALFKRRKEMAREYRFVRESYKSDRKERKRKKMD